MAGPFDVAMRAALAEARIAASHDDVPVGAVVMGPAGSILSADRNRRELEGDPTAHAEVLALRGAAQALGGWRLDDCTLVVTLEPCVMCAGAVLAARVPRIVIGAWDTKAGATGSQWDVVRDARIGSRVEVVSGVLATESSELLREFFERRR
jgi:tRNA(adenine34) deaminase